MTIDRKLQAQSRLLPNGSGANTRIASSPKKAMRSERGVLVVSRAI